jgi:hypothetical protein
MERRRIRVGLFTSSVLGSHSWAGDDDDPSRRPVGRWPSSKPCLTHTGAIASQFAGEVIESLDILSLSGNAVTITHPGVLVRKCRIRHAGGHKADGAKAPRFEPLEIVHGGATSSGEGANADTHNIDLASCPNAILTRIRASKGAANIYLEDCERASLSWLELHDARGPEPRGQNVQFNRCRNSTLEDFSAENGQSSWTEDNVSVYHSDSTSIRQGLVSYNDSRSGVSVMLEGSSDGIVDDVDAAMQGNGAFAAAPSDKHESGGCLFLRCRTPHSFNGPRDGREAPSSNGLSCYTRISPDRPRMESAIAVILGNAS